MATIVRKGAFSGSGGVWGKDGLESIIRPMLQDRARGAITAKNIPAITDNSTGVAASASDVPSYPSAGLFNATAAGGGVQLTAFQASVGKLQAAEKTLATSINNVLTMLGLPLLTNVEGVAGTANTLAALDKAATTAAGPAAVDFDTFVAATVALRENLRILHSAMYAVATALGLTINPSPLKGQRTPGNINARPMLVTPAIVASVTGTGSVALADGTSFLLTMANDYAFLAAVWNAIFTASTGAIYTAPVVSVVAG